jgi:hypothetical protein
MPPHYSTTQLIPCEGSYFPCARKLELWIFLSSKETKGVSEPQAGYYRATLLGTGCPDPLPVSHRTLGHSITAGQAEADQKAPSSLPLGLGFLLLFVCFWRH